jgi:hypothetical protein
VRAFRNSLHWFVLLLISGIQSGPVPQQASPCRAEPVGREWIGADGRVVPFKTDTEILDFLRTARPLSSADIGEGITGSHIIVLEKDGVRMRAIFHTFRQRRQVVLPSGRQIEVRDEYRFEPAAYELSRMLGLGNVPPAIMRDIDGRLGSLQVWIENSMTEKARLRNGIKVPNEARLLLQLQVMTIFDNLISNSDRNRSNILYDRHWDLWMIDHTRAFHASAELLDPLDITRCERNLWNALKIVGRDQVRARLGKYLQLDEVEALFNRLDSLVERIQEAIDERGSEQVLFLIPD